MQFSPDAKELIVQQMVSYRSDDVPFRHTVDDVVLTRLQLALDDAGMFKIAGEPLRVPRARSLDFLRIAEWPRITVWNHHLGAIEVLDLNLNSILTRVPLGDDKVLATVDPRYLEKPTIGNLMHRLGFRANMVTSEGKWGYYVPNHSVDRVRRSVGYLRRIDLTADPPKVVRTSDELQPNLRAPVVAVSGTAGALFVLEDKRDPNDNAVLPSPLVKTFGTSTLSPGADIKLSLTDCRCLAASHDGKYLYAVDFGAFRKEVWPAGMSVVDIGTGKEVKVLRDIGAHPALVLALP